MPSDRKLMPEYYHVVLPRTNSLQSWQDLMRRQIGCYADGKVQGRQGTFIENRDGVIYREEHGLLYIRRHVSCHGG